MPDAMSAQPRTTGLLWSGLGALVGLWIGYAVVAGMAHGTPSPPTHAQPAPRSAPAGLALTPPPALRVRSALFAAGPVTVIATPTHRHRHRQRHRAAARPAAAAPAPAAAMTAPAAQTSQEPITSPTTTTANPAPATPAQPTPAPRPVRKQQPSVVAKPKPKPAAGFDDSTPTGFDNSG